MGTVQRRINLVLLTIFLAGTVFAAFFTFHLQMERARHDVLGTAYLLTDFAESVRDYTNHTVLPLLDYREEWTDAAVPSFASRSTLDDLLADPRYHEYEVREASLDPVNDMDRATSWEVSLIQGFAKQPELEEVNGWRDSDDGRGHVLYLARPIRVADESCLSCHGDPKSAPAGMVARFGADSGFNWQLGQLVGAQVVTVPMAAAYTTALHMTLNVLIALVSIFAIMFLAFNGLLGRRVLKPLAALSEGAHRYSLGERDVPLADEAVEGEAGELARSINRLRRSLDKSVELLQGRASDE